MYCLESTVRKSVASESIAARIKAFDNLPEFIALLNFVSKSRISASAVTKLDPSKLFLTAKLAIIIGVEVGVGVGLGVGNRVGGIG